MQYGSDGILAPLGTSDHIHLATDTLLPVRSGNHSYLDVGNSTSRLINDSITMGASGPTTTVDNIISPGTAQGLVTQGLGNQGLVTSENNNGLGVNTQQFHPHDPTASTTGTACSVSMSPGGNTFPNGTTTRNCSSKIPQQGYQSRSGFIKVEILDYIDSQMKLLKRLQEVLEINNNCRTSQGTINMAKVYPPNSTIHSGLGANNNQLVLDARANLNSMPISSEYCSSMATLFQESRSILNVQMGRAAACYSFLGDELNELKQFCGNNGALINELDRAGYPLDTQNLSQTQNITSESFHNFESSNKSEDAQNPNGTLIHLSCVSHYTTPSSSPGERDRNESDNFSPLAKSDSPRHTLIGEETPMIPCYLQSNNKQPTWNPDYLSLPGQVGINQKSNNDLASSHLSMSSDQSPSASSHSRNRMLGYPSNRCARQNHVNLCESSRKQKGKQQMASSEHACSNCRSRITPQWRFLDQDRYCNACYMRYKRSQTSAANQIPKRGSPVSPSTTPVSQSCNPSWKVPSSESSSSSRTICQNGKVKSESAYDEAFLDSGPFTLGLDWMTNSFNDIIDTSSLSFSELGASQEEKSTNIDFMVGGCPEKGGNEMKTNSFQYNTTNPASDVFYPLYTNCAYIKPSSHLNDYSHQSPISLQSACATPKY